MIGEHASAADQFEVLTGAGPAAVAVVQVRGPRTYGFLRTHLRAARLDRGRSPTTGDVFRAALLDSDGSTIDDLLVTVHAVAPQCDVRLHLHGGAWVMRRCRELLESAGFSACGQPGAALWAGHSLISREAYALLPSMLTECGARWLLEQATRLPAELARIASLDDLAAMRAACEELVRRREIVRWFDRPLTVALVGPPNAGKSTLINALARRNVSVVSSQPGTTRDWVEAPTEIDGFPVTWIDTAGQRSAEESIESAAIEKARDRALQADLIVVVFDGTGAASGDRERFRFDPPLSRVASLALNKTDLGIDADVGSKLRSELGLRVVHISAATGAGLDALTAATLQFARREPTQLQFPACFSDRQVDIVTRALASSSSPALALALRSI